MEPGDLRAARMRSGLTTADVARITKLSPWAITAIECGRIEDLPPGLYTRAYLRAYAHAVRLDPEAVVQAMCPPAVEPPPRRRAPRDLIPPSLRYRAAALIDAAIVLAIAAAQLAGGVMVCGGSWDVAAAGLAALPALIAATGVLYVGILGATGVGTVGAYLFAVEFVEPPSAPLRGDALVRRGLAYLRSEAAALFKGSEVRQASTRC